MPIQEITSATHHVLFRSTGPGRSEMALADTERFSGNRDFILRYRLAGETIVTGLLLYQGRDENFFLLMAEPPRAVATDEIPAREYIFVVEFRDPARVSVGYVQETDGDLVTCFALQLFNVVALDGTGRGHQLSAATLPEFSRALQFIGRRPGWRTAAAASLACPRSSPVASIVLLTDGSSR